MSRAARRLLEPNVVRPDHLSAIPRYLCFKAEKEGTLWNCTPVGTVKTIADAEKFLDEQPLEQLGSAKVKLGPTFTLGVQEILDPGA